MRNYFKTHPDIREKQNIKSKERYKRVSSNPELLAEERRKLNIARNKRRFSGNRDKVLERDGHKCVVCKKVSNSIHHLDGRGYQNSDTPNNDMNNLVTVCRHCHITVFHRDNIKHLNKTPWNKGFTQKDPRVAKNILGVKKYCGSIKGCHNIYPNRKRPSNDPPTS